MAYIGTTDTYVTFDQVRFALGVAEAEVSDADITASGIEQDLEMELADWLPDGQDTDTIYTEGTEGTPTATQRRTFYSLSNYLRYYAAYLIATTAGMKFARRISDKSNDFERNPWQDDALQRQLLSQANAAKNQFLTLIGETVEDETTFMGVAAPDFDPITG